MIINLQIDLKEFYAENFDYDSDLGASPTHSLSEEVAEVIKSEVKAAISNQVREDVKRLTMEAYKEFGEEKMKTIVEFQMNSFIQEGKVKKSPYDSELIPVSEKLRSIFDDSSRWSSKNSAMEEIGKRFGEECRKRYDMAFASNIVKGLESQGLLKPGVFEAITSKGSEG